jgi:hypothetical protein
MLVRIACLALLAMGLAGCRMTEEQRKAKQEEGVRNAFAELGAAIEVIPSGDTSQLWQMLSRESRAAAEKRAKLLREEWLRADDREKNRLMLEVYHITDGDELDKLTARSYLKTEWFYSHYRELPGSTTTGIDFRGERATVRYLEKDRDGKEREELVTFIREDGEWKADLKMP